MVLQELKCANCGGILESKGEKIAFCPFCGSKWQAVEEKTEINNYQTNVKNETNVYNGNVIYNNGAPKLDDYMARLKNLLFNGDYTEAKKLCEKILAAYPLCAVCDYIRVFIDCLHSIGNKTKNIVYYLNTYGKSHIDNNYDYKSVLIDAITNIVNSILNEFESNVSAYATVFNKNFLETVRCFYDSYIKDNSVINRCDVLIDKFKTHEKEQEEKAKIKNQQQAEKENKNSNKIALICGIILFLIMSAITIIEIINDAFINVGIISAFCFFILPLLITSIVFIYIGIKGLRNDK